MQGCRVFTVRLLYVRCASSVRLRVCRLLTTCFLRIFCVSAVWRLRVRRALTLYLPRVYGAAAVRAKVLCRPRAPSRFRRIHLWRPSLILPKRYLERRN